MRDLKDGPEHFMLLFALVARVLGVFELILKFEERVYELVSIILQTFEKNN